MRKLKLAEHISLDGIIQSSPENNFPYPNWTVAYRTPEGAAKVLDLYGEKFDLLLGRSTYDMWTAFWPKAPGPMAERINAATKYVVTHNPQTLEWGPVQGVNDDIIANIKKIKATPGPDLILCGSSTITSLLLENGLADELLLFVYPVFLGTGKKFFSEGTPARTLKLEYSESLPSGILINNYKYVGELKNG